MAENIKLRDWDQMTEREQMVWAAAYAAQQSHDLNAAHEADRVVNTLAAIEWPEREKPEYRAARLCPGLTAEEFRAWYLVELRVMSSGERRKPPSSTEIDEAFGVYLMCGADFG